MFGFIKFIKLAVFMVLLIVILIALYFLVTTIKGQGGKAIETTPPKTEAISAFIEYLDAMDLITQYVRYKDKFTVDSGSIVIRGVKLPWTRKRVDIKTEGRISLGIECKEISIDKTRDDTLFMTLPPIKILTHEVEFKEIYEGGTLRPFSKDDVLELWNRYRDIRAIETINDRIAISRAEAAADSAFTALKNNIPALKDIPIVFRWKLPQMTIPFDIKRETPIIIEWGNSEN